MSGKVHRRAKQISKAEQASIGTAGPKRGHLYLSNAPADLADGTRELSDLRHDAGAGQRQRNSGPSPELIDMTRRFWIGTALAVPLVILEMGAHFPGLNLHRDVSPQISVWVQFLLATPVVLWAGGRSLPAAGRRKQPIA